MNLNGCLHQLISSASEIVMGITCGVRVFQMLDRYSEISISGGLRLDQAPGAVSFVNVEFAYASTPLSLVLKGVSLEIPRKSTAAFVGGSGSGKSTTLSLLARFYDVCEGSVCIDGRDVR